MIIHIDKVLLTSAESKHFLLTYQLVTHYFLMWVHRNAKWNDFQEYFDMLMVPGECCKHYRHAQDLVKLDLANEVAKLQGHLVLSNFRRKSHSSLVINTEHNGVVHRRVTSTCSYEHARARRPLIEAVRLAENLRKLAQSSNLHENMDQWRDRRQRRNNN